MPFPFGVGIAIGVAAGLLGYKKAVDASDKNSEAKEINQKAERSFKRAQKKLLEERDAASNALETLGQAKIEILHSSVNRFVDTFGKIHHIELTGSKGMEELSEFAVNEETLKKMGKLGNLATQMVSSTVEGLAAGGMVAFGAYSAVSLLGTAGTGTAIASLSGAAATNATLAWLGGGTLAAGGLGVAGGTAVLGGLIAGPALAVMGFMMDSKADENLDQAKSNWAKVKKAKAEMKLTGKVCQAIKERADMFTQLIGQVNICFQPMINEIEYIVRVAGTDYRNYNEVEKKIIAMALSTAGVIKAILDTPILNEEGTVTAESLATYEKVNAFLPQLQQS